MDHPKKITSDSEVIYPANFLTKKFETYGTKEFQGEKKILEDLEKETGGIPLKYLKVEYDKLENKLKNKMQKKHSLKESFANATNKTTHP